MKRSFLALLTIATLMLLAPGQLSAQEAPAASSDEALACPAGVEIDVEVDAAALSEDLVGLASPLGEGFQALATLPGPYGQCSGPYPPLSCTCGSCCQSCKCWDDGPYIALCFEF